MTDRFTYTDKITDIFFVSHQKKNKFDKLFLAVQENLKTPVHKILVKRYVKFPDGIFYNELMTINCFSDLYMYLTNRTMEVVIQSFPI